MAEYSLKNLTVVHMNISPLAYFSKNDFIFVALLVFASLEELAFGKSKELF